jgi:hypothetical protein
MDCFRLASAVLWMSCATQSREVHPEEMSAEAHRSQAAGERARSADEAARYDPTVTATLPGGYPREAGPIFPVVIYSPFNPTIRHLYEAQRDSEHALAHEQAAAELEAFEEGECREFPPRTRAACPALGLVRAENLPDGVRLHLPPQMPVEATLAHMRCHLAWARARGFAPTPSCPLYLRGTKIRRAAGDAAAVDLVSDDPAVARQLQQLTEGERSAR